MLSIFKPKHFIFLFFLLAFNPISSQDFFSQSVLPKPTGPFAVGVKSKSLTDSSRTEKYTHHRTYRRVQLDIWYPAQEPENQEYNAYLDGFSSALIYSIFKSKGIRLGLLDSIKQTPTYSYLNAKILPDKGPYPLLIFTPGFYFGMAPLYSAFMENLASHGYVVCSISHPYEQPFIRFNDGETAFMKKKKSQLTYLQLWWAYKTQFRKPENPEVIERITRNYLRKLKRFDTMLDLWMADTEFVLDYLFQAQQNADSYSWLSQVDLQHIGAFGQSFGGAVAGQLCLRDKRVLTGINMDGFQFGDVIDNPLQKPFMLIQSGYSDLWNYGNSAIYAHPQTDFYMVDIPLARHLVFSDAALIPDIPEFNRLDMLGQVDGEKTIMGLNKLILAFFNRYLRNQTAVSIEELSSFSGAQLYFSEDQ